MAEINEPGQPAETVKFSKAAEAFSSFKGKKSQKIWEAFEREIQSGQVSDATRERALNEIRRQMGGRDENDQELSMLKSAASELELVKPEESSFQKPDYAEEKANEIINAIQHDLAQEPAKQSEADIPPFGIDPNAKKPLESAPEPEQNLPHPPPPGIQDEDRYREKLRKLYEQSFDTSEREISAAKIAAKMKEAESRKSEFKNLNGQLNEFNDFWTKANDLVRQKKLEKRELTPQEKKDFTEWSKQIIKLAGQFAKVDLIKTTAEEFKQKYAKDLEEWGIKTDKDIYKRPEFRDLITNNAEDIYKRKLDLYNMAVRVKDNTRNKAIFNKIILHGKIEKNGKEEKVPEVERLRAEGKPVDGKLFFKKGKYYFKIAGLVFAVGDHQKIEKAKGKPPAEPPKPATAEIPEPAFAEKSELVSAKPIKHQPNLEINPEDYAGSDSEPNPEIAPPPETVLPPENSAAESLDSDFVSTEEENTESDADKLRYQQAKIYGQLTEEQVENVNRRIAQELELRKYKEGQEVVVFSDGEQVRRGKFIKYFFVPHGDGDMVSMDDGGIRVSVTAERFLKMQKEAKEKGLF